MLSPPLPRHAESSSPEAAAAAASAMMLAYGEAEETVRRFAEDCLGSLGRAAKDTLQDKREATDLILRIWEATAQVIAKDLEAGRNVLLPPLGTFELRESDGLPLSVSALGDQRTAEQDEVLEPFLLFSEDFLEDFHLICDPEAQEASYYGQSGPSTRVSVAAVARLAEVDKDVVKSVTSALLHRIGQALAISTRLSVGFTPLGTLSCTEGRISFEAMRREAPSNAINALPTVKAMIKTKASSCLLSMRRRRGTSPHPKPPTTAASLVPPVASPQRSMAATPITSTSKNSAISTPPTAPVPTLKVEKSKLECGAAVVAAESHRLLDGSFSRDMPPNHVEFPSLLEESGRTRAVPHSGVNDPGSPSGRIAGNYAQTAARLTARPPGVQARSLNWLQLDPHKSNFPKLPKRDVTSAGGVCQLQILDGSPVDLEIQEVGLTREEFYEGLHRYHQYVSNGIDKGCVAPYNENWTRNIEKNLDVTRFVPELTETHAKSMLSAMGQEVKDDYFIAVRRAIVDHVLEDEKARERAGVFFLPRPPTVWGQAVYVGVEGHSGGAPEGWHMRLRDSRLRTAAALANCNSATLRLLELWHRDFDNLLLVDLPSKITSDLVDLSAFCQAQTSHCAKTRQRLEKKWLGEAAAILGGHQAAGDDSHPAAYPAGKKTGAKSVSGPPGPFPAGFQEAACTLLSTQVRGVVERSIAAYVSFFKRFARKTPLTPGKVVQLSDKDDSEDAFFVIGISAKHGDIQFTVPLDQVKQRLLSIFRNFVVGLRGLHRPDAAAKVESKEGSERPSAASPAHLWEVSLDEPTVKEAEAFVEETVSLNLENVHKALKLYDGYRHLLSDKKDGRDADNSQLTREDYMARVDKLRATESAIRENCPNQIRLQLICIDCAEINDALCKKAGEAVQVLLQTVLRNLLLKNDQLVKSFESVVNHMVKKPTSELELVDLEAHVDGFRAEGLDALLEDFRSIRSWLDFLFECEDRLCLPLLSHRHFQAIHDSACWVHSIDGLVADREANLRREREALESKFKEQRNKFLEDLDGFNALVERFRDCGNLRQVDDYLERIQVLRSQFARAHIDAEKLNDKEERLGWEPSQFEQLKKGEQGLEPHHWLWTLAYNLDKAMKQWLRGPLFHLDPAKVEAEVGGMRQEATELQALFEELLQHTPAGVASQLLSQVNVMVHSHLGLLHSLCNKSLRTRHWEAISNLVGFAIEPDSVFTLSRLIDMDVGKHLPTLRAISEAATKEHVIERVLDAMQAEWKPVQFELKPWRRVDTFIIAENCADDMRNLVDCHLGKTRSMRRSPHVLPWVQRVSEWEEWLEAATLILEYWMRLQASWTRLEAVFSSRDVLRQMPAEGQQFRKVDESWRELMKMTNETKQALFVSKEEGLLDILTRNCSVLDIVTKGLEDFLESKRLGFPRFFFISDTELLSIVSSLAEVEESYGRHLPVSKFFQGIQHLQFSDSSATIVLAMASADGEVVSFASPVGQDNFEGGVEEWFRAVEVAMMSAVRVGCLMSLQRRAELPIIQWLQDNLISQTILCASAILWTQEVSLILQNNTHSGFASENEGGGEGTPEPKDDKLPQLASRWEANFSELASALAGRYRQVGSEGIDKEGGEDNLRGAPPYVVKTAEALAALTNHQRDVLQRLVAERPKTEASFEWLAQLRYYVETTEAENRKIERDRDFDVVIDMLNVHQPYNYEFLGCSELVITPLTERVYRALCGCVQLHYAGALIGPSGGGKSATAKEFARAFARMCFSLSCAPDLPVAALARLLKGTAGSGLWLCLDDVSSVATEVLSVAGQQLLSLQQAMVQQLNYLDFDGVTLRLVPGSFVMMTLRSGEADRPEMPECLRIVSRELAMPRPDFDAIAQGYFCMLGFGESKLLARRLALFFASCRDCIGLDNTSFGMGKALSVLACVKRLWSTQPIESETDLVVAAIYATCAHLLHPGRVEYMGNLIRDAFPGHDGQCPLQSTFALREAFRDQLKEILKRNTPSAKLELCAMRVHDALATHTAVIALGETCSGKTTTLSALSGALLASRGEERIVMIEPSTTAEAQGNNPPAGAETPGRLAAVTEVFTGKAEPQPLLSLNPSALSLAKLFGCNGEGVEEQWSNGILTMLLSFLTNALAAGHHALSSALGVGSRGWLHLDGHVTGAMADMLGPVLDGNLTLCLQNGDVVQVHHEVRLVFEVEDLQEASPSTIARCGVVMFDVQETMENGGAILEAWAETHCIETLDTHSEWSECATMLQWLAAELLYWHESAGDELLADLPDQVVLRHLVQLLDHFLHPLKDADRCAQIRKGDLDAHLAAQVGLACIWAIGSNAADERGRKTFDRMFSSLLEEDDSRGAPEIARAGWKTMPEGVSCFDVGWDAESASWISWLGFVGGPMRPLVDAPFDAASVLVPTVGMASYINLASGLCEAKISMLLCGAVGCGKNAVYREVVRGYLSQDEHLSLPLVFSSWTTAEDVQGALDGILERQEKRSTFGPPSGHRCLVLVDDMNLPLLDVKQISAAPGRLSQRRENKACEFLRQLCCLGGWYGTGVNRLGFKHIADLFLAATCRPMETTGSEKVSPRLLRHFLFLGMLPVNAQRLEQIFMSVARSQLIDQEESQDLLQEIAGATSRLWEDVSRQFPPIPSRAQQFFGPRNVLDVLTGMFQNEVMRGPLYERRDLAARLWTHECQRVFGDRLADARAQAQLLDAIVQHAPGAFGEYLQPIDLFEATPSGPLFGQPSSLTTYDEVLKVAPLLEEVKAALEALNEKRLQSSEPPLRLIVFSGLLQSVLRMSRALRLPGGHSVLIGSPHSGRRSIARLSASMVKFAVRKLEATGRIGDWAVSIKRLLRGCLDDEDTQEEPVTKMVLFSDNGVSSEKCLDDIHRLMCGGALPEMWTREEQSQLVSLLHQRRQHAQEQKQDERQPTLATPTASLKQLSQASSSTSVSEGGHTRPHKKSVLKRKASANDLQESISELKATTTPSGQKGAHGSQPQQEAQKWKLESHGTPDWVTTYQEFSQACCQRLRLAVCISSSGALLRSTLRSFPGFLRHAKNVEWSFVLPAETVQDFASSYLEDLGLLPDDSRASSSLILERLYRQVPEIARQFSKESSQLCSEAFLHTPAHFRELLSTYSRILAMKQQERQTLEDHCSLALLALKRFSLLVGNASDQMQALAAPLQAAREDVARAQKELEEESARVAGVRAEANAEEASANEIRDKLGAMLEQCEAEINAAAKGVEEAVNVLSEVSQADIAELRQMKTPPAVAKKVVEAVGILKGVKVVRMRQDNDDGWGLHQKMLADSNLLTFMLRFEKEKVAPDMVKRLNRAMAHDDMKAESVAGQSKTIQAFYGWVKAMHGYDSTARAVKPRQEAREQAQINYEEIERKLQEKKNGLKKSEDKLTIMREELDDKQQALGAFEGHMRNLYDRREKAEEMIASFGQEEQQFLAVTEGSVDKAAMERDSLLVAAAITYFGCCDAASRPQALAQCVAVLEEGAAAASSRRVEVSVASYLQPFLDRSAWVHAGLMDCDASADSAAILAYTVRVPVCMDPQDQASRWLREVDWQEPVLCIDSRSSRYVHSASEALFKSDSPVVIEHVACEQDNALEQLIENYMKSRWLMDPGDPEVPLRGLAQLPVRIDWPHEKPPLVLITKALLPQFSPAVVVHLSSISFALSPQGLEDRLLSIAASVDELPAPWPTNPPPDLPDLWDSARESAAGQRSRADSDLRAFEAAVIAKLSAVLQCNEGGQPTVTPGLGPYRDGPTELDEGDGGKPFPDDSLTGLVAVRRSVKVKSAGIRATAEAQESKHQEMAMRYGRLPLAVQTTFMAFQKLVRLCPMYQLTMTTFLRTFFEALAQTRVEDQSSEQSHGREQTLCIGFRHFLRLLLEEVTPMLFRRHRQLFSLLLALELAQLQDLPGAHFEVTPDEANFLRELLAPERIADALAASEKPVEWLNSHSWTLLQVLMQLPQYESVQECLQDEYRAAWESVCTRHAPDDEDWPEPISHYGKFQKALVLCCMSPLRGVSSLNAWASEALALMLGSDGPVKDFVRPVDDALQLLAEAASKPSGHAGSATASLHRGEPLTKMPLTIVLQAPGTDALPALMRVANRSVKKLRVVMMGLGQGKAADVVVAEAARVGWRVVLHNCHLEPAWLPKLDALSEDICGELDSGRYHKDFHLWLTVCPCPTFPQRVLEKHRLLSFEEPLGLRSAAVHSVQVMATRLTEARSFQDTAAADEIDFGFLLRRALSTHSVVVSRCAYGCAAWTSPYFFAEADLQVMVQQMQHVLNEILFVLPRGAESASAQRMLLTKLIVAAYDCRIVEGEDRRVLNAILEDALVVQNLPADASAEGLRSWVQALPTYLSSEHLGFCKLGPGAEVVIDANEAVDLLAGLHSCLSPEMQGASGEESRMDVCGGHLQRHRQQGWLTAPAALLRPPAKFPVNGDRLDRWSAVACSEPALLDLLQRLGEEVHDELSPPLSTANLPAAGVHDEFWPVIHRDIESYNRLSRVMLQSLDALVQACAGQRSLTAADEDTLSMLLVLRVPRRWSEVAFQSVKPLPSFLRDFKDRRAFVQSWLAKGPPSSMWMPGFFHAPAFLVEVRRFYARKHGVPMDALELDGRPITGLTSDLDIVVHGVYLQGCAWSGEHRELLDSTTEKAFVPAPALRLLAPAAGVAAPSLPADGSKQPHIRSSLSARASQLSLDSGSKQPQIRSSLSVRASQLSTDGGQRNSVLTSPRRQSSGVGGGGAAIRGRRVSSVRSSIQANNFKRTSSAEVMGGAGKPAQVFRCPMYVLPTRSSSGILGNSRIMHCSFSSYTPAAHFLRAAAAAVLQLET
eukprot:TRINITY_DN7596_c0_g2_i1.p1 TRINITY_DN7596_c0_g2~~TRINITY_DN7596_c0_g2_i1.p1  ORF type:complete len:4821 (+),score=1098.93 TRINITY_DN7596_c0_g2_i1:122-14584(+)